MKVILACDDGSRAADRALAWASRLAEQRDVLLKVVTATRSEAAVDAGDEFDRIVVRDAHPAAAILTAAEDVDADLIVLGRRGSGGFPSLPIGTTAHSVAAVSARPTVIVPTVDADSDGPLVRRAVVGIDGLPGSTDAATWAARQWPDAQFVAVHALELAPSFAQIADEPGDQLYERAHARSVQLMEEWWVRPLRDTGVSFDTIVEDGGPAEVLLGVATRLSADLVVVGRRDHHLLRGTLGGVSQRVLAYSPCPAVVVPSL
jgi:nucleotide-binding universal stress UspA family protein